MSQVTSCSDASVDADLQSRLGALLRDALDLIDAMSLPPEIGARFQEVIDMTESHFRQSSSSVV
jgi:hypothetical protein